MSKKVTTEDCIKRFKAVHGDDYIYDEVDYKGKDNYVKIICKIHGPFWQTPNNHYKGKGCPICGTKRIWEKRKEERVGFEDFVQRSKVIHGDKYVYDKDKINYVNTTTPVNIWCKLHGEFSQTPKCHMKGQGCPECGKITTRKKESSNTTEFVTKAKTIHGNDYIYDNVDYVNATTKVKIICKIHGPFWQVPCNHLSGKGCPFCGGRIKSNTSEFIREAKKVHGDKYIYDEDKINYVNNKTKVCITCREHGDFWQNPYHHLKGCGCPKCGSTLSKGEDKINNFINTVCHIETITRDRKLLGGRLECDIVVPSCKLAIEFNGLHWHTENNNKDKNYHLNKTELAESKGYHLIHIFEDEWLEHKELVLNKIRHFLGKDLDKPVIGARKCVIKTVSKALSQEFLATYHLQGFSPSTALYGAFYGDILVGVMTFKKEKDGVWNFNRFATNTDYRLPGLASKMFKQFIKDNTPVEVKAFLDRRWSHHDSNLYDKLGFKLVETVKPDYCYTDKYRSIRSPKSNFRKQNIAKKYNLPLDMTEKEMVEQLGFYRIWDCGLYKYVWKPPT